MPLCQRCEQGRSAHSAKRSTDSLLTTIEVFGRVNERVSSDTDPSGVVAYCALLVMAALMLVVAVPAFAQEGTPPQQPSALDPAGPNSAAIANVFNIVLIMATVVFVVVEGLICLLGFPLPPQSQRYL